MAILPIIIAPDVRLKAICKPVDAVDDAVRTLMDDMLETMYASHGIGLAAAQVGSDKRVVVIDMSKPEEPADPLYMANPEIIWVSDDDAAREEGCLSLPEQYSEVVRPTAIRVRYLDRDNEIREFEAEDYMAVCIQHELDHLDGVLFVDHISALRRNMILRKLTKIKIL